MTEQTQSALPPLSPEQQEKVHIMTHRLGKLFMAEQNPQVGVVALLNTLVTAVGLAASSTDAIPEIADMIGEAIKIGAPEIKERAHQLSNAIKARGGEGATQDQVHDAMREVDAEAFAKTQPIVEKAEAIESAITPEDDLITLEDGTFAHRVKPNGAGAGQILGHIMEACQGSKSEDVMTALTVMLGYVIGHGQFVIDTTIEQIVKCLKRDAAEATSVHDQETAAAYWKKRLAFVKRSDVEKFGPDVAKMLVAGPVGEA